MLLFFHIARSTYYYVAREKPDETALEDAVETVFNQNRKVYGSRKIKAVLKRLKIIVSRRKIIRIMTKMNLHSAYSIPRFKVHQGKVNDSQISNVLNRQFTGHPEYASVVSDLTYVRVNYKWNYTCLLVDLFNREIIGFSAGVHKNAELVYDAFITVHADLSRIDLFHTDRGGEFDNHIIDEVLNTFDISRSHSLKGCPYDNAVAEATSKIFKSEFVNGRNFESLAKLKIELAGYINWFNQFRIHSSLGYLSPKEFKALKL